MSLAAGKLNKWVRLERFDPVEDSAGVVQDADSGEVLREWTLVDEVWAAIEPLSVREFNRSGANQSESSGYITLRYRSDLNATWRVVHRSKIYNPKGVLPDKGSGLEYVTVPYGEGVNAG